jgi:gamma-glutamyltranspeptidase / glutathione hydrolase
MSAADAVNKPKFHHQWLPDVILVEEQMDMATKKGLIRMGYEIKERKAIGRTEVIKILANGIKDAAADIRGDDSVAGY